MVDGLSLLKSVGTSSANTTPTLAMHHGFEWVSGGDDGAGLVDEME